MLSDGDFAALMDAARDGSREAIESLLKHFSPGVLRAVRRRLARKMRPRFDSVDFVQAVWGSFFTDPGLLAGVDSPDDLGRLLATMAQNKVIHELRRQLRAAKRDVSRERSLHGSATEEALAAVDRQPTPSQLFVADERWNQLLDAVPSRHRQILMLRRDGLMNWEIAEKLHVHERTVERILSQLRLA